MELRNLKTFVAVARLLSFHRAAETLHYAQSTVSAQIQALEDELGVKLFDRLGRRILLTEAGERLLNYAGKMIDLEEEAVAEVTDSGDRGGSLCIRVPETFGSYRLPDIVRRFHDRMPNVGVQFITCTHEGLYTDLRKGVTDLAFLYTDSLQASDLEFEVLGVEPLVLAVSPGHALATMSQVTSPDLDGQTILLSRVDCSYRRLFEAVLAEEKISPGARLEFHSMAGLRACVGAGVGVTILPEVAAREDISNGRMAVIPWAGEPFETALLMVWHKEKWLSPALKAFMALVRESVTQQLGAA
jgi:DNA-binding transcriptional LysR family regulator